MTEISFTVTEREQELIDQILERIKREVDVPPCTDFIELEMSLKACHNHGTPIDFEKLVIAPLDTLVHDVFNINKYIDTSDGHLRMCFLPRCAKTQSYDEPPIGYRSVINRFIEAGWYVTRVCDIDGEEIESNKDGMSKNAAKNAIASVDESRVTIRKSKARGQCIHILFVLGNRPDEDVSDYCFLSLATKEFREEAEKILANKSS